MKLYNTLTRKVEEIKPLNPPNVTIYTCGPTVYDYPHIGNWFTFVRYDLLIRTLKLGGYKTDWVINITDVGHLTSDADEGEDKLEKGAAREGKSAWEIAKLYSEYFLKGLDRLNITRPNHTPKATEHIKEQIDLILKLEEKGYTYIIDDGVYYDTSKFPTYHEFAQLDLGEQMAGARVSTNNQKKAQTDFALWKFSPKDKKRDMEWDSPWGKGFPGWHIECSAMCLKYLGETIDVHAGGIDHIPLHHTNEIAQSEAANSKNLANYWMHANFITISGDKIAKSLNNSITLEDIENKSVNIEALRLLILQSHYRSQSQFSLDILTDADLTLKRLTSDFSWIYSLQSPKGPDSPQLDNLLEQCKNEMRNALFDDLDTPKFMSLLHSASKEISTMLLGANDIAAVEVFTEFVDSAVGIRLLKKITLSKSQTDLISERERARANKDWDKSDEIRKQLEHQKIGLRDTKEGTIWYPL